MKFHELLLLGVNGAHRPLMQPMTVREIDTAWTILAE